jgi:hypothetical protein
MFILDEEQRLYKLLATKLKRPDLYAAALRLSNVIYATLIFEGKK